MRAAFWRHERFWLRAAFAKFFSLKRELAWVLVGQASAAVAGLVGVRLMTGLLSPTAYGELALGMTVAMLIGTSLFGPLINGFSRYYAPALGAGELGDYLHAASELTLSLTGLILMAAAVVIICLLIESPRWAVLGIASVAFAIPNSYNAMVSGIQNAARRRSIVAVHQAIDPWVRFGAAAVFVSWLGATGAMSLFGYTLGISMVLTSQLFLLHRNHAGLGKTGSHITWRNNIVRYSWPFYTWSLFQWAQLSSDRWALALLTNADSVGLYSALFQLGSNPVAMASTMALQLLAPIFYQRAGDGRDRERNAHVSKLGWRLTIVALSLTGLAAYASALLHGQIFRLLVAGKYAAVSFLLPYVLLAGGIFAASQLIELSLMSQMKTRMLIVAKICAALLGIALNFAGAYWHGVRGVVLAGLTTSIFYFFWMLLVSRYVAAQARVTKPQL